MYLAADLVCRRLVLGGGPERLLGPTGVLVADIWSWLKASSSAKGSSSASPGLMLMLMGEPTEGSTWKSENNK